MDFDATSLYPCAMWDKKSINAKTNNGFAFKPHMIDVYGKSFLDQTFNQNSDKSAILKLNYYNLPNPIFNTYQKERALKNMKLI